MIFPAFIEMTLLWLIASRRQFLLESSSTAATTLIVSANDDSVLLCQENNMLTEERAIPGAYENVCMTLPVRTVTIDSTILSMEQQASGPGATGLAVWNSSLLLTRLMPLLSFRDTTVVELGCGTGLASLVAATQGAERVYATDGNPNVVQLANRNIQRNNLQNVVQAVSYQWGYDTDPILEESADWVIGSDLTYNPGSWPLLADAMASLVKPDTGIILYLSLGHPGFNVQGEINGFLSVAQSRSLRPLQLSDPEWPFRKSDGTPLAPEAYLHASCRNSYERSILESGGGARVLFLQKRVPRRYR
jgi:SAM-dependent methyltransferase